MQELEKLLKDYRLATIALEAITYRPTGKLGMLEDERFAARSIYRLSKKFFIAVDDSRFDNEKLIPLLRHISHGLTYIIDDMEDRQIKISSTYDCLHFLYQVENALDALVCYYYSR